VCTICIGSNYTCILIDWLIVYYLTSCSRFFFYSYGDVTIAGEGLQNLGICSGPLSMEGSLSYPTYCDTGPPIYPSDLKDYPIQSPRTTRLGMRRIYSKPHPHGRATIYKDVTILLWNIWLGRDFQRKYMYISGYGFQKYWIYEWKCFENLSRAARLYRKSIGWERHTHP
jgi:hypothetical protein